MLIEFFFQLREAKIPVSIGEYLSLLGALKKEVIPPSIQDFYFLSRLTLVKDEKFYDRFDQAFSKYFAGVESIIELTGEISDDWLVKKLQNELSPEEKAKLEKLGGLDALMKRLDELIKEQNSRHEGGKKWIGTGGSSPFGHSGYHPEGIRIKGESSGNRTALKVWEQRTFKDYDDQQELNLRNIKIALRRLRQFARTGIENEFDLDNTIQSTAANAGYLDIKMRPERHNNIKVVLLMDVGGSMDDHIQRVEELFSAAKSELKHLEYFYFHNCLYDYVWKNNQRRHLEKIDTMDLINKYSSDYKVIFVGDATMSPYEILSVGGSVEYNNTEPGAIWINRILDHFKKVIWLNPEPQGIWQYRQSVGIVKELLRGKMFPVTLVGLERAMSELSK
jgi:hypothetical protein